MKNTVSTIFTGLFLLFSPYAMSEEGIVEINQTCAENGGCFAGDDPGFPVEITEPGSYVLTSNLVLPAGETGASLQAEAVTLDLNGFEIRGPESCDGTPVVECSGQGTAFGVIGGSPGQTVKNGKVSGFSGDGVALSFRARLVDLQISENGGVGVQALQNSAYERITAIRNGDRGIFARDGSVIRNSLARGNGATGVKTGADALLLTTISNVNGAHGFALGGDSTLKSSSASDNEGSGIFANTAANVVDVTAVDNGMSALDCGGMEVAVRGSMFRASAGQNALSGLCVELGQNLCGGDTNC